MSTVPQSIVGWKQVNESDVGLLFY